MSIMDRLREVSVDDTRVMAPENVTPAEIIQLAGKDPSNRDLVSYDGPNQMTVMHPKAKPIAVKHGDRFSTQLTGTAGN